MTTAAAPAATDLDAARRNWDARYEALSGVRRDINRSMRWSIGKSYADEAAERTAMAEVEAKIVALGWRP